MDTEKTIITTPRVYLRLQLQKTRFIKNLHLTILLKTKF